MSPQSQDKQKMLDRVAEENGVAVVVLDEHAHEIAVSNNNSICRALTSSPDFAPRCGEYCGRAFQKTAGGDDFEYRCYAGLTCRAIPVSDRGKRFVAIVGRTFTSAEAYRDATERAIAGDWREFQANDFFENVLLDSSLSKIEKATEELGRYRVESAPDVLDLDAPSPHLPGKVGTVPQAKAEARAATAPVAKAGARADTAPQAKAESRVGTSPQAKGDTQAEAAPVSKPAPQAVAEPRTVSRPETAGKPDSKKVAIRKQTEDFRRRAAEAAAMRSLQSQLADLDYPAAVDRLLEFVRTTYRRKALVWLECHDNRLVTAASTGAFRDTPIKIGIPADNERLLGAVGRNAPLELRERVQGYTDAGRTLFLFPTAVGGMIRGAVGVEGQIDDSTKRAITRLCRRVGPQLEILRLKHEASSREWLNRATTRFTESLKRIDAEDFWMHVTQISAELVQSERASLLVQNDQAQGLRAKAAVGSKIDLLAEPQIGDRVARIVLEHGKPVVVPDINQTRLKSAPTDWKYKTGSFISYPILIGERRLAVMNFTDKAGGAVFEERDVELLDAIAPQIAVAIDRTTLKDMAGEFEQLSVTDSLTGLLNRRYLEKRLNEEIQRSKRHRFPMSLMLLDVDDFKSYNDTFGHPAGDTALKVVANVLKDMLRGADVAARYGGEEFAILLPQTTSAEAAVIAERLRQRIEHTEFPKRKVTISIGIASCSSEIDTPEDIVAAADHALYEAKNHGRNNVQIYDGFGKPLNEKIH